MCVCKNELLSKACIIKHAQYVAALSRQGKGHLLLSKGPIFDVEDEVV